MPTIRIEYDNGKLEKEQVVKLSEAVRGIVMEETGIEDTFVYANSAEIKLAVAPVEVYVQLSAQKIKDVDNLFQRIKVRLSQWRKESSFPQPINLTLIPMQWKFEVGI